MSIKDSVFKGNSNTSGGGSDLGGGALFVSSSASGTVIEHTVFESNTTQWSGGGASIRGSFVIKNSLFKSNIQSSGCGAGLYTRGSGTVEGSTFMNNVATFSDGGGYCIYGNLDSVEVINSTFYGNTANSSFKSGGGIYADLGNSFFENFDKLRIVNSTIVGNSSNFEGSGLHLTYDTIVRIENSIVSGNTGGPNCHTVTAGYLISEGFNIDSGNTCGFAGTGDLSNTNPLLVAGAPVVQSGFVPTIALQVGSPAVNTGQSLRAPLIDARGATRVPATCDRGAFEL